MFKLVFFFFFRVVVFISLGDVRIVTLHTSRSKVNDIINDDERGQSNK